jgi:RimJ/RimL family protein N-acetyltransferase
MTSKNSSVELRSWQSHDLTLLQRLMGDPKMTVYLGGTETSEQIINRHKRYCETGTSGKGEMFVILSGTEAKPAGSIGFWEKPWQGELIWEIGWSVLPEFQGQGIATKAVIMLIEKIRRLQNPRIIHAFPAKDNLPSNALCRKLGFILTNDVEFEYPPGNWMQCKDWHLNLY